MNFKQGKCLNGEATLFHYVSDLTPTHASNSVQKAPHCRAITACLIQPQLTAELGFLAASIASVNKVQNIPFISLYCNGFMGHVSSKMSSVESRSMSWSPLYSQFLYREGTHMFDE